jgi:hypothetical protein
MIGNWERWLIALVLAAPAGAAAQQPARLVRVSIDYLAGENLYISAGSAQGLFAQDTVNAFAETGNTMLGRLVIVNSTKARAVAAYVGAAFPVARGAVLMLEIPQAAFARMQTAPAKDTTPPAPPLERSAELTSPRAAPAEELALHGRIGLDVDASQSTSQWGINPGDEDQHRFHNQVARLRMTLTGLPGGARLFTNLHASNYGAVGATGGDLALRIYQASLEKEFTRLPLRLQLGRFYNPYESHSGFWDGGLVRVGGEALGAGVVVGYEPDNANETFSATRPKLSGFLDLHQHRGSIRYDGDLSWHRDQPQFSTNEREYFGITQRFSWRGAFITQRAQVGMSGGPGRSGKPAHRFHSLAPCSASQRALCRGAQRPLRSWNSGHAPRAARPGTQLQHFSRLRQRRGWHDSLRVWPGRPVGVRRIRAVARAARSHSWFCRELLDGG